MKQIARCGQYIAFATASTRGNFSFSAAAVRRRTESTVQLEIEAQLAPHVV
jgi:hypothetical protein